MNLRISPKKLIQVLSIMAGLVFLLHVIACIPVFTIGRAHPFGYLSLDGENNLPTIFSVALLWCNALLAGCITRAVWDQHNIRIYWALMAMLFLAAGVDEATQLHEKVSDIVGLYITATGVLYFAWVLPYTGLMILLLLLYIRFFIMLPKDTRRYLLVAGFLYCAGAIGFEMLGGWCIEIHGRSAHYYLWSTGEEMLEMSGSITAIYALSNHIVRHLPGLCITFSGTGKTDVPENTMNG